MDDQASSQSQPSTGDDETLDPDDPTLVDCHRDANCVAMATDAAEEEEDEEAAVLADLGCGADQDASARSTTACSSNKEPNLNHDVLTNGIDAQDQDDPDDVINNGDSLTDDTDDDLLKDASHFSPGDHSSDQAAEKEFKDRASEEADASDCNRSVSNLFADTDCDSQDANGLPVENGRHIGEDAEAAEENNHDSIASVSASISAAETDDSQMTFIEENNKNDSDATAESSLNASPRGRPTPAVTKSRSHFEQLQKDFSPSPRADSSDRSLPTSREGSVTRDGSITPLHTASPERTSLTIKRNTNRPRGRESILQRLTDSLLAKKEKDFKAKFSDSESNGASPMHFSDSNDSFTMGPHTVAKSNLGPASVYDKISESDSSNHPSPAPTPPPRDLNESGPRKPNIRWNFNRVKHLRNVISNILDRESSTLDHEGNLQNASLPMVNGNDHKDKDSYVNGESKQLLKFSHKRRKSVPLKHPKPLNATNGIIKCKFCPFSKELGIGAKSAVQRHERCHYTHGPFTCKICTFSTNNWNSIKMHKQLHIRVGDCMPDEDCVIRNFPKKEKKKRGRQVGRPRKTQAEKKINEVDYSAFQRSLNDEAMSSTPRMYSSQSVYPGGPDEYNLLDGYPSATPVSEQPIKQMPSLARITSSPSSSPGHSTSPAPCLTPPRNHHCPSPLSRVSQTSSPSRTPIHMTTLHPVDLTSQALDLSAPALDLSARREVSSDLQDSSMDLSVSKDNSHEDTQYSDEQPDFPVDLSVSKCTNNFPEYVHYSDSTSGFHSQVSDNWHTTNQRTPYDFDNRSQSPSPQRSNISDSRIRNCVISDSHMQRDSVISEPHVQNSPEYVPQEPERPKSVSPIPVPTPSPKTSPVCKEKAEDSKYQAKCPFCPFEAAGHKAARAVVMKHQTCHYADKRYKCDTCKFSSDTVEIMRNHILLHPVEERNVLRNGVSIGGVIQPLRKRLKSPKIDAKSQGDESEKAKSVCSDQSSLDIDVSSVQGDNVASPQTSPQPSKRVRKRKINIVNATADTGMDLSITPEKVTEPTTKSPGPVPGTRAATLISETEIRKVSPPPKKRFMEKVVAEREAAKLNEMRATELANKASTEETEVTNTPNEPAVAVADANKEEVKEVIVKKPIKPIERKPRARRSRLLFADEQALLDDKSVDNFISENGTEAAVSENRTISEMRRPSSANDFVDYDSEDFLKGFQKLNILHCPYCPFKTTGRSHGAKHNLAKHEKCHGMKARFICDLCSFGTKYMDSYKKHKALHVETPNFKPRKCPPEVVAIPAPPVIPKRKVVSKKTGVKPVVKAPKTAPAAVTPPAGKEKTRRRKGINFSKTPLKKFNLKCRYCPFQTGANYAAKYNLLRHEKAHFQNNAYKCDHCTFSTAEYRKFKMHVLLHLSDDDASKTVKQEVPKQTDAGVVTPRIATRRISKDSLAESGAQALGNAKEAVPASPVKAENVKLKGKQAGNKGMKTANKKVPNLKRVKADTSIKTEPVTVQEVSSIAPAIPAPPAPAQKTKKAALTLLQKAQRARNIKKSLILSCKFCPFKTCGTSAAARYNLKLHEDCHFRVSTYRCEICSFTTKKFIVIKKHRLLHSENTEEGNPLNKLKCDACEFEGEDLRSLEEHKMSLHPSQNLDQEARLADTPPSMPSPEMKPEASGDLLRQQQNLTQVQGVPGVPVIGTAADKQTKKMLEIPAELWYDAQSQLYHCQWCDFTSKREHFFKVHLYCHQRKNVKFRCKGCGYGATRQAFLDHHYKEHHNEDVKNKVWASKEERAAVLKPKDLYTAVTERLKLKGLDETLIETFSPSKSKGKSQPSTPFLVPAVPPPKPSNSQPSFKRPNKPANSSPRAKRRRCHPIPAHVANPTGPEQRYLCSLCPFSTKSREVQSNHQKKHMRPDQFSCPYCTYNTRTRVYLEKHIKLHFTASLQDEAVTMLPLDFTQNLVRTEPRPAENWELDTSNLGKAKRQTKSLPRKQCRFCDRMLPIDELKYHEDRHLVGCAYLKFIDCGSPTHESEQS